MPQTQTLPEWVVITEDNGKKKRTVVRARSGEEASKAVGSERVIEVRPRDVYDRLMGVSVPKCRRCKREGLELGEDRLCASCRVAEKEEQRQKQFLDYQRKQNADAAAGEQQRDRQAAAEDEHLQYRKIIRHAKTLDILSAVFNVLGGVILCVGVATAILIGMVGRTGVGPIFAILYVLGAVIIAAPFFGLAALLGMAAAGGMALRDIARAQTGSHHPPPS